MTWRAAMVLLPVALIIALLYAVGHYRDNAIGFQKQRNEQKALADSRQATINDMQRRQQSVAAIDARYTKDLADAKANLEQLKRDIADGSKRLRVSARCDRPVPGKSASARVDDDGSARLTDAAQRDYFTLRERIVTVTKQVDYLQDFIKEQCSK